MSDPMGDLACDIADEFFEPGADRYKLRARVEEALRATAEAARRETARAAANIVTEHYQSLCTEHKLLLVNRSTAILERLDVPAAQQKDSTP